MEPRGPKNASEKSGAEATRSVYGNMEQWTATLFYVYYVTDQILKKYWQDTAGESTMDIPIPVDDLARWLGFTVEQYNLNRYRDMQISLTLGRLIMDEGKILVDNGIDVSPNQRRYAIAHELGHAYFREESSSAFMNCTESRIPGNQNEFLADVFASFLMLPPRETFQYVITYIRENRKRPIDHEKMMLELSDKAKFPFLKTITSYEYLRFIACYEHNHKDKILQILKNDWQVEDADVWLSGPIAAKELYN